MQIVLRQVFPLGRFHATPWRVNPFDDPFGEWPPSPWRFVRAVVARWYQWAREAPRQPDMKELGDLVRALCNSRYAFHLPKTAARGNPLRQYFPTEFAWDPGEQEKAGMQTYRKSLAQDNYWCTVPTDDGAVWWILDGADWNDPLLETLDRCLERILYFGRAESFTRICRVTECFPKPNCSLREESAADTVPVLVPQPEATREDVERVTDDERNVKRSVPPGARVLYAVRPLAEGLTEVPLSVRLPARKNLIQFALAWNVAPPPRSLVQITARFRDLVLAELLREKTGGTCSVWARAPREARHQVAPVIGKDADGWPLTGHQHAEFLVWCRDGVPVGLIAWRRGEGFELAEEKAILAAATKEVSWSASYRDADAWKVKFLPLDDRTPPPPGFDGRPARVWESVTPCVPARHYLRRGKLRERELIPHQVRRELALRNFPGADAAEITKIASPTWVAVHVPPSQRSSRTSIGDRRAYWLRIVFPEPVSGPIRLGQSSALGLGLFRPAD